MPIKNMQYFYYKKHIKITKVATHNFKKGKIIMIFRTNKITNYTKIDNKYLEDKKISLKAKGLLTLMLSLPDSWKFNINGLCLLCKESRDAVRSAINELKENHYVEMERTFDENGRFNYEYFIYENPDDYKANVDKP